MKSNSLVVCALAGAVLASALLLPPRSNGQAAGQDPAVAVLINELTAQQAVLADNQNKIDAKLASIAENIRLARIFAARVGGRAP